MTYMAAICALQIAVIAALILDRRLERQEVARERRDLLQAAMSPEHAVVQHYNDNQEIVAPPAVNPDLDEDYWLGRMSKDELADRMAEEEVTGG